MSRRLVDSESRSLRKLWSALLALLISVSLSASVRAQQQTPPNITTVAGGGPTVIPAINGAVNNVASTGEIGEIVWDSSRSVFYFTSSTFNRVYKYDPAAGQATAIAGTGFTGYAGDGGPALQAVFAGPLGLALDATNSNTLYVGDTGNNRVRRIDLSTNTVDTIAGDGSCITAQLNYTDVPIASANVCAPGSMTIDGNGVLYLFDLTRRVVWRLGGGQARMIAGNSGASRPLVPVAADVATNLPLGDFGYIAVDPAGQFLYLNETIGLRQLNLATGILSAPLDISANKPFLDQFGAQTGYSIPLQRVGSPVAVDPATGNVIYAIYEQGAPSESLFSINPANGQKTFIAGKGSTAPAFLNPTSDVNLGAMNNATGELVSIVPTGNSIGTLVASRSGWIHTMNSLTLGANFTTILGNGFKSWCGDGGPATLACLDSPSSVAANPDGSFVIADTGNGVVRFVDTNGIIHSLVSPLTSAGPPTSVTTLAAGVNLPPFFDTTTSTWKNYPPGTVFFTSAAKYQVFALDPVADKTRWYSGDGKDACQFLQANGFCDPHYDFGLGGAEYNQPRGLVIDQFGNPFLADPYIDDGNGHVGVIDCLLCDDQIIGIYGMDANTFQNIYTFGNPYALAVDPDGLLVAEKGAGKIQHLTAVEQWQGIRTGFSAWPVTDILNGAQRPLGEVVPFQPVGIARIPGLVIASDDATRIVWSATRPLDLGPCPQGASCIAPPPPPQVIKAFAGGGTLYQDNIPGYQAAFGFRQVEAGVFDPFDSFGELASAQINGNAQVYITDRADNRIRMMNTGVNHPPVANAGPDRKVPLTPPYIIANVWLDGSASTDPDGDALSYAWDENGTALGTGPYVQTSLSPGKHTITLTVADGFGGTSSATVNITATPPVDLAIVATPSATTLNTGDTLTYNATVSNLGPNDGTGVVVTLPIDSNTNFASGAGPGGVCTGPGSGTAGVVTCPVGSLANGTSTNITLNLKPQAAEMLTSVLTVSGDQGDPDNTNNAASLSVTVKGLQPVQVNVNEVITVTDNPTVTPSVMISDPEKITVTDTPNVLPSVMLADPEQITVSDTPSVAPTPNTPVGQSSLIPPDQTGNPSIVSVTFSGGVTAAGYTFVNVSPTGPALPGGFQLGGTPPLYFDVQTTAQFNAPVLVCVPLNPIPLGAALLHFNSATQQWEDFTIRPIPSKGPICTQVNSLSPFVVVRPSDITPPTITCGSPDGQWHATDVSIACTAADSGSGLANAADASFSLTTSVAAGTETSTAQTGTRTVCDVAGNCAVAGPIAPIKVDKKGPSITLATPADGAVYLLNQSVKTNFACSDGGSGISSCSGTVASGNSLDTASAGQKSFTVTATDAVGNNTQLTVHYTVTYAASGVCDGDAGHQILQPINADGTSVWKQGRTVPAKFRVCDAQGVSIGTPGVVAGFALVQIISGTTTNVDETVSSTTPDAAFRWDSGAQQWIFNVSTANLSAGQTYVYLIRLNDGSSIGFRFGLR